MIDEKMSRKNNNLVWKNKKKIEKLVRKMKIDFAKKWRNYVKFNAKLIYKNFCTCEK